MSFFLRRVTENKLPQPTMLRLVKTYLVFDLGSWSLNKSKSVKGLHRKAKGSMLGNINGVFFKFCRGRVMVVGPVGDACRLSFGEVDAIVCEVTGVNNCRGKVVTQVFHTHLPAVSSSVKLALLHHRIANRPPRGLLTSTLDYQVSDKLVVKLRPYQDGFSVTMRVSRDGSVEIAGDARGCVPLMPTVEAFLRRCSDVLQSVITC